MDEQGRQTSAEESAPKKEKKRIDWKKELREWTLSLVVALAIVFVVRTFLFTLIHVEGDSMYDTLIDTERLFVTIADVRLGGVQRGDVVICHYPGRGRTYFVKRVVGMPGDQVERENGVNYVTYTDENGESVRMPLDSLRERYYPYGGPDDYEPYTLGEDEYFVVGDNRYVSHDSRDWRDSEPADDVGPITGDMIIGRARRVIWPPSRWRAINREYDNERLNDGYR